MTVHGASHSGTRLLEWGVIPIPLATTAVILRFLSRHHTSSIGADDYLMLIALFLYYTLYGAFVVWVKVGYLGWPQKDLDIDQIESFFKVFFSVQLIYALVGPAIKLSILMLYWRIFFVIRPFIWAVATVASLVLMWSISVITTCIFQCTPVGTYWKLTEPRHCIDEQNFYWGNGVSNLLLDFTVLCLPAPVVWRLQMSTRSKVSVTAVFMLGMFVCTASVLRITYLWRLNKENVSGTLVIPTIWTSLEPGLGIVTGCVPVLPPLLKKWSSSLRLSSFHDTCRRVTSKVVGRSKAHDTGSDPSIDGVQLVPGVHKVECSVGSDRNRQNMSIDREHNGRGAGGIKVHREVFSSTNEF